MALSSVRGTRATRRHNHGLPLRRFSLSCSAERQQRPLLRPTPPDPKRPDAVSKTSSSRDGESASSVLARELLDDALPSKTLQEEDTLGGEVIDEDGATGDAREEGGGKVLVVKKPPVSTGPRGDITAERDAMKNVLKARNEKMKTETDTSDAGKEKSKVVISKRPVQKQRRNNAKGTFETEAVRGDIAGEEATEKPKATEGKRDGNVLIVRRSSTEPATRSTDEAAMVGKVIQKENRRAEATRKVIERPRPYLSNPSPKGRRPTDLRPNVIVGRRPSSLKPSLADGRGAVDDRSAEILQDVSADDAIELGRTKMEQTTIDDSVSQSSVLVAKRSTQKVAAVSNNPGEFLKIDGLSEEDTELSVGDVDFSVGGSGDGTPLGGQQPSTDRSDEGRGIQSKGREGMGGMDLTDSVSPSETFDASSPGSIQNGERMEGDEREEKKSEIPSLSAPPSRTRRTPSSPRTIDSMIPEEEEGMRIRQALLRDIQEKRQGKESKPSKDSATSIDRPSLQDEGSSPRAVDEKNTTSFGVDEDVTRLQPPSVEKREETASDTLRNRADATGTGAVASTSPETNQTSPPESVTDATVAASQDGRDQQATVGKDTPHLSSDKKNADDDTGDGDIDSQPPETSKEMTPTPPKLKLQGPPKKPEAPTRSAAPFRPQSLKWSMRQRNQEGQRRSRPSPGRTAPVKKSTIDARGSKGLRSSYPPPAQKTKNGNQEMGRVTPPRPRLATKPAPVLVKKPSKGEHNKPATIELDRQIMKEKDRSKRDQMRAKVEEDRAKLLEARRLKAAEAKKKTSKRSDPGLIESRRKARMERQQRRFDAQEESEGETIIEVGAEGLSVESLGSLLAMDPAEVMKVLFMKGVMVAVNQTLDVDSVKVVAAEAGVEVVDKDEISPTDLAAKQDAFVSEDDEDAVQRPPVVTVMGHVDHGKTTLLDYIRQTKVASSEAGGITQAIGAYTCTVDVEGNERTICFLDTPGHEAFSAMRARGTRVTDIAVIIVAADDGMRPQTREAIDHAKAANVPIVVAINKIDATGADPERVKRELSEIEMLPEEWGGQTPVVKLSAKTGEGVDALLEMLTLVSDIQLDLRANTEAPAKGTVIEAYLDKRSGVMATLLVQNGTLHLGDAIAAGAAFGKVRSLTDASGNHVASAGPSTAVRLMGFHDLPLAGDIFTTYEDEAEAKDEAQQAAEELRRKHLIEAAGGGSMVTLSSLASVDDDEDVDLLQRLNLVLKSDTVGSLEAAKGALAKLPQDSVMIRYLHASAGEVTESDVLLASAADGIVVGFNASVGEAVKAVAKQQNVELRSYEVIYDLIDDVRNIMEGELRPTEDRLAIGQAEVRAVFGSGSQRVAGCMVTEGRLEKDCFVRVIRKKSVQFEGSLNSLRRVKDKVETVDAGLECGVGCEDYSEWHEGDRIEAFTVVQKRATLEETRAATAIDQETLRQMTGSTDDT